MTKLFLSPSTQDWNAYKTGSNEEVEMRKVVVAAVPYLTAAGFTVKVGGKLSASDNVKQGNAWGADYYIAVHSNAGGGDGTVTFYHSSSAKGKKLANAIHAPMAAISPGRDDGVKSGDKFIEINGPHAPAALVEVEFHDSRVGADWIKANNEKIGKELARGILNYFGKSLPDTNAPKPEPVTPKPTPAPAEYPVLDSGDQGKWVKKLQDRLNAHGAKLVEDGDFGPKTEKAVIAFQKAHGLTADGIVGPKTWSKLLAKATAAATKTGTVTAKSGLRVRKGPGTDHAVVGSLPYGTKVKIVSTSDGWDKIIYHGDYAYASTAFIK